MAKTNIIITGTIADIKRLPSSKLGNPAYMITITTPGGGTLQRRTQANTSVAYAISDGLLGQDAELILTPGGRIFGIKIKDGRWI